MKLSRGKFLKVVTAGVAGVPLVNAGRIAEVGSAKAPLTLGMASYTLRSFSLDEVIEMLVRLEIKHVALKSMHLPLDASDKDIQSMAMRVRDAGIDLYGVGVIYIKSEQELDNAFRYAQAAGVKTIIGVPNHDLLPLVDAKVKETDIRMAIHNHGPGDDLYPSPESIMDKVKNLDPRVGVCLDIGHAVRIGLDPVSEIKRCGDRLYDMHLKDVNVAAAEGGSVEMGRGVIDIPRVLKAIQKSEYMGVMGMEYEKDGKDPLPGVAESVGYCRGVMTLI